MSSSISSLREEFSHPSNAYRHLCIIHGFPRDDSSSDLEEPIRKKLSELAQIGFGGVVANVGPDNYLESEKEWGIFAAGFKVAKDLDFRLWIYDEHGYPSGSAGGLVLRDHPEYEAQALVKVQATFETGHVRFRPPTGWLYCVAVQMITDGSEEVRDISSSVSPDGFIELDTPSKCTIIRFDARRAFEGTHATRNCHCIRRYINVLDKAAVSRFFDVTAQQYIDRLGDDASRVEAIFTDEPSFMAEYCAELSDWFNGEVTVDDEPQADFDQIPMIAWDSQLAAKFSSRWQYDLLPELNRLFEGNSQHDMRVRHDFYQLQAEIYADTFFSLQQERLRPYGIAFSGHVLAEESLTHHVAAEANVLADLKRMQIPGIDMLDSDPSGIFNSDGLLTCKYGSSAAHIAGATQVMCEISDFQQRMHGGGAGLDMRRGALALQMALGITTFASYYSWQGMDTAEVRNLLDFAVRISVLIRESAHVADVAVLYPIRAAWAAYKPANQVLSSDLMDEPLCSMDDNLHRIASGIFEGGLDFDFIDTRDLIDACKSGNLSGGKIQIASESYSLLILPPGAALCPKDAESVEAFVRGGGKVLAFDPLSDFAIPEIASPPTGTDIGPGRSVRQLISALRSQFPEQVMCCSLSSEWMSFVWESVPQDIFVRGSSSVVARRSSTPEADIVLLVNTANEDAFVRVLTSDTRSTELWDPMTGEISSLGDGNRYEPTLPPYGAMIYVFSRGAGERRSTK